MSKPTYLELVQKVKSLEKKVAESQRRNEASEANRLGMNLDISELKKSDAALKESEALYRSLFENAPVGMGIVDENGDIIDFNEAILKPGAYAPEDIAIIKNIEKLYFDQKARGFIIDKLNQLGHIDKAEVQFKRKDGRPYNCLLSLKFITYKGKRCTQAIVQDMSGLREIEKLLWESRERFLSLVETTSDWIWEVDIWWKPPAIGSGKSI
jgi:PAS domain S-box-containing protein